MFNFTIDFNPDAFIFKVNKLSFDLLKPSLSDYFNKVSDNIPPVKFFVINSCRRLEMFELPIGIIMLDINDTESCLFKKMSEIITDEDIVERKINILHYLLEILLNFDSVYSSDYVRICSFYFEDLTIKYHLKNDTAAKCYQSEENSFNLSKLSAREWAEIVVPCYYIEIGHSDRDFVRQNSDLMKSLRHNWMDFCKNGLLD